MRCSNAQTIIIYKFPNKLQYKIKKIEVFLYKWAVKNLYNSTHSKISRSR